MTIINVGFTYVPTMKHSPISIEKEKKRNGGEGAYAEAAMPRQHARPPTVPTRRHPNSSVSGPANRLDTLQAKFSELNIAVVIVVEAFLCVR